MRYWMGTITAFMLALVLYGTQIESAEPELAAPLREIVLIQPDFKAKLHYDRADYDGVGIDTWTDVVLKKGALYRFEAIERNRNASRRFVILGYPGKNITVIFPDESRYSAITQDDLDKATFTTLEGMDLYYITKLTINPSTRFEYVTRSNYNGCSCLKIRVTNESLLKEENIENESLYLMAGPLYLYACPDMKNLIIGVTVDEAGSEKEIYSLKDISFDSSQLPLHLFRVSPSFKESE